jgi:hypothetical protein
MVKVKTLHKRVRRVIGTSGQKSLILGFVVLFAVVGMVLVFSSRAAVPSVSIEPESNTLSGSAVKEVDSTASAGSSVAFGSRTSPPPAATTIPDTNYSIPSGAIFVATSGSDANPGTQTAPVATLSRALTLATSGKTIVMRAGVYRQGELVISKSVTIQPFPHEQVWFDGSTVTTAWTPSGSNWKLTSSPSGTLCKPGITKADTITTAAPSSSCSMFPLGVTGSQINPAYPLADSPQMVFVEGSPFKEVGSVGALGSNSFYYDATNNDLYIGTNPAGKTIEVTTLRRAMVINAANVQIKGIGLRRYGSIQNTASVQGGAYNAQIVVNPNSDGLVIENNAIVDGASRGININGADNAIIRGNYVATNGMNGIDFLASINPLVENNTIKNNNNEHFSITPGMNANVAGVMVICDTRNPTILHTENFGTVRDNIFDTNYSNGFWASQACTNMKIVRNLSKNNDWHGLYSEACNDAIIASNLSYGNKGYGLYVIGGNNKIYNNTFVKNMHNLAVVQFNWGKDVGLFYETVNNVVKNNIFSDVLGGSNFWPANVAYQDLLMIRRASGKATTPRQMVSANDYNAFYRSSLTSPATFMTWGTTTLAQFSALTSVTGEVNSKKYEVVPNPYFKNYATQNYQIAKNSPVDNAGDVLPSAVASAIGVPTSPVNIGAITWPGADPAP